MAEVVLAVGEPKLRQFQMKRPLAAVAELVWNALDANASSVSVTLDRGELDVVEKIIVTDDGHGITPDQANESFAEYGDTWKSGRTHTLGERRILHGRNGEGRLFALTLGETLRWRSVARVADHNVCTEISGSRAHSTRWNIEVLGETSEKTGTVFEAIVPHGRRFSSLEADDAADNLAARLAFYLHAYPEIKVEYDGAVLNPEDLIESVTDLELDLPPEYKSSHSMPFVTFVEWRSNAPEQKMLVCNEKGLALSEFGDDWHDAVIPFTPYLRWQGFNGLTAEELHILPMKHASLLYAADRAIRKHLAKRRAEVSSQVIDRLKDEGLYPYDVNDADPMRVVERQTFDLVVTVARTALPTQGPARHLSVNLIQAALEHDPSDLHEILGQVLSLSPEEKKHLSRLIDETQLSSMISAATTVVDRLSFIGGLRKIFADREVRLSFREVDQLHPMIAKTFGFSAKSGP